MKINSTVALTLILLTLMAGAGVVSGVWGYTLGREALRGVTQPDVRPTSLGSEAAGEQSNRDEIIIIPESKIIEDVKNRMNTQPARSSAQESLTGKLTQLSRPNERGWLAGHAETGRAANRSGRWFG
ncbi:MAG: hypothetical protein D6742_13880 [Cyanobacteria bacterium J069]|nr:MAG: hypothetical protein D6742_13880 [Cyanobacteria bacterium J069]